jgi:hypothetical protein
MLSQEYQVSNASSPKQVFDLYDNHQNDNTGPPSTQGNAKIFHQGPYYAANLGSNHSSMLPST